MKQPDLGKKIADLRKAKGLTQDELVAQCKLNVRTLQRIECGEVTPRSYTLKIIFAALDYNFYDSSNGLNNRLIHAVIRISGWLEQFYRYFIDLFNFKTNAMKKIMILSVPFLTICAVLLFSYSSNVKAQNRMAIKEKFEKVSANDRFLKFFNAGQIDSVSADYLEKACFMPDQYSAINGRKGVNDYYSQLYLRGLRFSELKSVSKVFTDSIAIDRGIWSVSINSVVVASGTYLTQWHYINGKWFIENEMSKADAEMK